MIKEQRVNYYVSGNEFPCEAFGRHLGEMISRVKEKQQKERVLFLCIGSDRSTGDSLGPLTGHLLRQNAKAFGDGQFMVFGTLALPVHAMNLERISRMIKCCFPDYLVVAVDASIGNRRSVGCITLSEGGLKPGCGVNKKLQAVGDISITGIVSWGSRLEPMLLQNIRLGLVMNMADCISRGILKAVF